MGGAPFKTRRYFALRHICLHVHSEQCAGCPTVAVKKGVLKDWGDGEGRGAKLWDTSAKIATFLLFAAAPLCATSNYLHQIMTAFGLMKQFFAQLFFFALEFF